MDREGAWDLHTLLHRAVARGEDVQRESRALVAHQEALREAVTMTLEDVRRGRAQRAESGRRSRMFENGQ